MLILCYTVTILLFMYGLLIAWYDSAWQDTPEISAAEVADFQPTTSISVIIPARNEAANIEACLRSILAQDYPKHLLQVLVIDDHSTDDTAAKVEAFNLPEIRLIHLSEYLQGKQLNSYKKAAIETGIAYATGDLIVTTDADCITTTGWLLNIAALQSRTNAAFIAAPVKIETSRTMLSIFQALDFMTMQAITAGAVSKAQHAMCNGANLAYLKSAFIAVRGFEGIDNIASGDDMLLMHKIATKYPTRVQYLKSRAAIVRTAAVENWSAFFRQRIRWASKAGKYDDKRIFYVLLLLWLLNFGLLILALGCVMYNHYWSWLLSLLLIKTYIEFGFVRKAAVFFDQPLMKYFPFLQPLHILYTVIAGFLGSWGSYEWKGRTVK